LIHFFNNPFGVSTDDLQDVMDKIGIDPYKRARERHA